MSNMKWKEYFCNKMYKYNVFLFLRVVHVHSILFFSNDKFDLCSLKKPPSPWETRKQWVSGTQPGWTGPHQNILCLLSTNYPEGRREPSRMHCRMLCVIESPDWLWVDRVGLSCEWHTSKSCTRLWFCRWCSALGSDVQCRHGRRRRGPVVAWWCFPSLQHTLSVG
jgi:hypothetical protein